MAKQLGIGQHWMMKNNTDKIKAIYISILYMGHSPKLYTKNVTSTTKIQNGWYFSSHFTSTVSEQNQRAIKVDEVNNVTCLHAKENGWIQYQLRKSSTRMHKLIFIWQSMIQHIFLRSPAQHPEQSTWRTEEFIFVWAGVALPFRDFRQTTWNITYFASTAHKNAYSIT